MYSFLLLVFQKQCPENAILKIANRLVMAFVLRLQFSWALWDRSDGFTFSFIQ